MKKATSNPDTVQGDPAGIDSDMQARLRHAAAMPNDQIDLSDPDAPPVADWSGAVRGRFYKPVKRLKSFRIDADVLAYFEGQGKGYQATVNRVLREAMIRSMTAQHAGSAPAQDRPDARPRRGRKQPAATKKAG